MRAFAVAVLILAGAVVAPAQRGGGGHPGFGGGRPGFGGHPGIAGGHPGFVHGGTIITRVPPFRTYGSPSGFGNILSPGLGTLPPLTVFPFNTPSTFVFRAPSTFPQRFGATISGFPGFRGSRGEFPVYWPYPVYVPEPYGYPGSGYGYAYGEMPQNVIVVPPQQTTPPVTIYQQFAPQGAQPEIHEYGPGGEGIQPPVGSGAQAYRAPSYSRPAPSTDEIRFLIPLKDNSVYTAVAYWVEGDTLHYITPDGRHNQVSLDLVDRNVAERLNRGSKAEFRLPPAKK